MYLYYDRNGTLKEIINDKALRGGNENINRIYVYWEDEGTQNLTLWARYVSESKVYYPSSSTYQISSSYQELEIPYDKNRDLKFFKYYKPYKFYIIDIPSNVLGWGSGASSHYENGVSAMCSFWFSNGTTITAMSNISFNIERTTLSVAEDENINVAQWNMLLNLISEGVKEITINTATQIVENKSYLASLSSQDIAILDNVKNTFIKINFGTTIATILGVSACWVKRVATTGTIDTFECTSDKIDNTDATITHLGDFFITHQISSNTAYISLARLNLGDLGTKIYKHRFTTSSYTLYLFSNKSSAYTNISDIITDINNKHIINGYIKDVNNVVIQISNYKVINSTIQIKFFDYDMVAQTLLVSSIGTDTIEKL